MTFGIDPKAYTKLNQFITEQFKITNGDAGAIGGEYTYHFTPTSLGLITIVENNLTKQTINLTDYESW